MDEEIRRAIRYLSRCTGRRFHADLYSDLYQAGALRICEEGNNDRAAMFAAAKRGVAAEYQRYYRERRKEALLLQIRRSGWRDGGLGDLRPKVEKILLDCRQKKGGRGKRAAERDATILELLTRGYSDDGVALELSIPYTSVREYRKIIKKSLKLALEKTKRTC